MKRKISLLLVIAMMTSFTLGGCNSKSGTKANEDSDVIKIGVFEPMTGANAAGGQLETEGAKLANKIYPTVLGKKVELVLQIINLIKLKQLVQLQTLLSRSMLMLL